MVSLKQIFTTSLLLIGIVFPININPKNTHQNETTAEPCFQIGTSRWGHSDDDFTTIENAEKVINLKRETLDTDKFFKFLCGSNPLIEAAWHCKTMMASFLIAKVKESIDLNYLSKYHFSKFFMACGNTGQNALGYAIEHPWTHGREVDEEYCEIIELLIDEGIKAVNERLLSPNQFSQFIGGINNRHNWWMAVVACKSINVAKTFIRGVKKAVELGILSHTNFFKFFNAKDDNGLNVLMNVANYLEPEKVEFLIQEARECFTDKECNQFLNAHVKKICTYDTEIKRGMTALALAARYEHCLICDYRAKLTMEILIKNGAI